LANTNKKKFGCLVYLRNEKITTVDNEIGQRLFLLTRSELAKMLLPGDLLAGLGGQVHGFS
jgi:hypothetical protein